MVADRSSQSDGLYMTEEQYLALEEMSDAKYERLNGMVTYKTVPTIAEHIIVGSETKEIIVYRRENNWRPYHYQSGDLVELTSIGVSFPFDEVYRRIFP